MGWKHSQEELNLDSKLREFFSWPIPNLRMADKSVHFTRFLGNLVPKVLNVVCAIHLSPVGLYCIKIFAPYGIIYTYLCLFMPIYIVRVYFFDLPIDFASAQK
jgi:hypothetical protein